MSGYTRPKVGVAAFIKSRHHPNCVLLGIRKGSDGAGYYAPPGGHLEFGEQIESCAARETLEETGLALKNVRFEKTVNAIWPEHKYHYIDLICSGEIDETHKTEPENTEPHKCEGWEWIDWDKFPPMEKLFWPLRSIRTSGYSPFAKDDA